MPGGQENGQTHDHCFELNSLIVAGALRQFTFQAVTDGSGEHEVFEIDYNPQGGSLRRTGTHAHLEQDAEDIFESATVYRLAPGIVHCVETVMRPTATLVLSVASAGAQPPRVFVPVGQEPPGAFTRRLLGSDEIAIARNALDELRRG